jgi:hypothetical protein
MVSVLEQFNYMPFQSKVIVIGNVYDVTEFLDGESITSNLNYAKIKLTFILPIDHPGL